MIKARGLINYFHELIPDISKFEITDEIFFYDNDYDNNKKIIHIVNDFYCCICNGPMFIEIWTECDNITNFTLSIDKKIQR